MGNDYLKGIDFLYNDADQNIVDQSLGNCILKAVGNVHVAY